MRLFLPFLLLLPLVSLRGEEVGPLADPTTWSISGATTFPPAMIRDALADDPPVLALLRPGADRRELCDKLVQRTALGYACAGFAACRVRVRTTDEHLSLLIEEGPRDRRGEVRIAGAVAIPAGDLRTAVTTSWKTGEGSSVAIAWTTGEPVDHDLAALGRIADVARTYYREHHHPQADIAAQLVPGADDRTLDLLLTIRDEGPAVCIGRITLDGCRRFDPTAVRALIPLQPGDLLPGDAPALIAAALRGCGRIRTQRVVVTPQANPTLADIAITITEGLCTPAPDTPLTAEQEAALRAMRWLSEHGTRGPEQFTVTATTPSYAVHAVFAGGRGMALRLAQSADPQAGGATLLIQDGDQWVGATAGRIRLPPVAWTIDLSYEGSERPPPTDGSAHETSLRFELAPRTVGRGHSGPLVTLKLAFSPFCALRTLCEADTTTVLADGVLTVRRANMVFTADAGSGRLRSLELTAGDPAGADRLRIVVRSADGDALAAEAARLAALPAAPGGDHPCSAAIGLLADEARTVIVRELPVSADRDVLVLATGLAPWVCGSILARFEQLFAGDGATGERFTIPTAFVGNRDLASLVTGECCRLLGRQLAGVYPAGSWPVTLPRSLFLLLNGQQPAALADLRELGGQELGPFGCLGAAMTLNMARHPGAVVFADMGLSRLADADLARELPLLAPLNPAIVQALDTLPTAPAWLADLTPDRRGRTTALLAIAHAPGPDAQRVQTLLTLLWHAGLRDVTSQWLTGIAQPAPP